MYSIVNINFILSMTLILVASLEKKSAGINFIKYLCDKILFKK